MILSQYIHDLLTPWQDVTSRVFSSAGEGEEESPPPLLPWGESPPLLTWGNLHHFFFATQRKMLGHHITDGTRQILLLLLIDKTLLFY